MTDTTQGTQGAGQGTVAAGGGGGTAGGATTPWYEGKADPTTVGWWEIKGWGKDDPAKVAIEATTAYRELEKFRGVPPERLVTLPDKADDPTAWNPIWQRFGAPKEAKEYDLSSVKFADGTELEDSFATTMRDALYKAHVAKDAAPEVVKAVVKYLGDADAAEAAERAATLKNERAALMKDWGKDSEYNRLTAMQGARRLGVDPDMVAKLESVVGYSKIMEMFRKVGAGTTEDTFVSPSQDGQITTANGAKAELERLSGDQDFQKRYLSGDVRARQQMDNLQTLLHGTAA